VATGAVGLQYRTCPECDKPSAFPMNKVTCCLRRGARRTYNKAVSFTMDEVAAIARAEVERALQAERDRASVVSDESTFLDGLTVLITDPHIPLHHVRGLAAVTNFLAATDIRRLVFAGDIFDATKLGRHPKQSRNDGHSGDYGDELYAGRHLIADMVDAVDPAGECWIFPGNHEQRLERKLAEPGNGGIPADPLDPENLLDYYEYPKRLMYHRERKLRIGRGDEGSVYVLHGEKYNKHRAAGLLEENLYQNTVQGHTHRPQTYWFKGRFGLVNGYLHDPRRQSYEPDPSWTLGFTIFEHWDNGRKVNPYFVRITDDGSFSYGGRVYRG
jgi:hypothetical protein